MTLNIVSCKSQNSDVKVIPELDINRYMGVWYEIARFRHSFEKNLVCVSATYSLREDGKVAVLNQGHRIDKLEKVKKAKGIARIPNIRFPAKLKVSFFWPFSGNYWIMALDDDYQNVLIGSPSRKYLWILSRTTNMDPEIYKLYIAKAAEQGFDTSKLEMVAQDCSK